MLKMKKPILSTEEVIAFRQFSANFPTQIASTLYFSLTHIPTLKKIKRPCNPPHGFCPVNVQDISILHRDQRRWASDNTGLAKVAVKCFADTFVVNQSLVLRINICGENRHLRQARKR
jgi:hypothetical protein